MEIDNWTSLIYNKDYITKVIIRRTAMPPKVKITKKMVADASFEVIRANGHENLNARTISEYLGCSTQPVLYSFKTVGEIREAAYEIADGYHTMFIVWQVFLPIIPWNMMRGNVRRCWRMYSLE